MAGLFGKALGFGIAGTAAALAVGEFAAASGDGIHPASLPWAHKGAFTTFDHNALRRGFQVYRQVCSACHSIQWVAFRQLVGVTHTEEEMKAIAAEYDVTDDEPDAETGLPLVRKGKLTDFIPGPYKNDVEAKLANNGALPPDFTFIRHARTSELDGKKGEDYIFALLTGYCDAPAGVQLGEGMNYNPYFAGGAIGMAAPLYNEIIQYEDGTPATLSQLAADVSQFLCWASMPEHDERKQMFWKFLVPLMVITTATWVTKRHFFAGMKTSKASFRKLGEPMRYKMK